MRLSYLLLLISIYISLLKADSPIAIITKTIGKVKYKYNKETKYHINAYPNMSISLNSSLKTKKRSFSKIIFLDDGAIISMYPKSEISINDSINESLSQKQIIIKNGVINLSINQEFEGIINLKANAAELNCDKCSIWIISNQSNGDKFILESGMATVYSSKNNKKIDLISDSTAILFKNYELELVETSISDIQYLESLELDADEIFINYNNDKVDGQKKDLINNIITIKLTNIANEERKIILTYTKNK